MKNSVIKHRAKGVELKAYSRKVMSLRTIRLDLVSLSTAFKFYL